MLYSAGQSNQSRCDTAVYQLFIRKLPVCRACRMQNTGANIRNMLRIFGGDPDGKVARLLSYAGSERDISDPWYTGEFGTTYNDVLEGCTAFLRYLQQNGRIDT